VYDDYHTVIANTSIQHVTNLVAIVLHDVTRPLVNFTYAVDRATWGAAPFGFHITNVLLHAFNVGLFVLVASRSGLGRGATFAASALFAVHPMMTEAVGYVSGRSEVLCVTFLLAAMLCAEAWCRDGRRAWLVAMIAAWLAALLSKETAAMFPLVVFVYDVFTRPDDTTRARRLRYVYLPLIAITILAGIVRLFVLVRIEYPGHAAWHWPYLLIDADVFRRYLAMMVIPTGQAMFHEVAAIDSVWNLRVVADIAILVAFVGITWRLRRGDGFAAAGLAWFLLLLIPSSVLIALDQGEPMTEHRVYAASVGLFFAAGCAMRWIDGRLAGRGRLPQALALVSLAAVVVSFAIDTLERNIVWSSPIVLWQESVDLAPRHPRPRMLLAESLVDAGRWDDAIEQYRVAVQLRPADPDAHVALGRSLAVRGELREARRQFHDALKLDPANGSALQAVTVLNTVERRMAIK
jgi:hypothetical protein